MSCGCDNFGGDGVYNNICNADTPYPIVSAESVPSLISNLTLALYGQIQKDVSGGKVVWIIPCDPNNTAFIGNVPRQPGEGLMCYFIRYFNTVYPNGVLGIAYGGTGATTAQAALSNLGGAPATRQIITAPSSGLSGGGNLTADRSLSIANTTVVPGTYGANNRIPVLTVNARGQLTGATTVAAEGFASVDAEVITAADPSPNVRQTVFNLTSITYSPGTDNLAVYRNGLRLLVGQDYTETNSTTVTLTRGVAAGNQLLFESGRIIGQDVSSVAVATQRITASSQQTVFNLTTITYVPGNNSLAVYSNGLKLSLGLDYTETNSATVTLTNGATAGDQLTFEAGKMLSQPVSATVQTQTITSSLGQTVFSLALSYTPNIGNLAVYKDGLRLISGTDYTETNSNTVTLTTPALAGRQFMFEVGQTLAQPAPVAAASELKTATANQTQFTLTSLTYVPNTLSLSVYRNGLKLVVGTDYTETNSNTVTLTSPAALGDQFVFEAGKILTNALAGTSVGFQQAGTGAVVRNIQDKARETVSVLDFGADPTGNADSTVAFQAALAASRQVFVPSGTYLANITITQSGSKLIGDSEESTTIKNWSNSAVVTIDNSGGSIRNVQIENIYFRNRNKLSYPLADGLVINGVNGLNECDFHQVINCTFFQFRYGIYLKNRTIWNRWVQVNVVESIIDGVNVEATDNIAVQYWETCRIAANGRYGIFVNHTFANFLLTAWTFVNCNLENNVSVPVRVTGTYGIQNWSFIGCYSEENAITVPVGVPKAGFIFLDSPYCFGLDFKNCALMGNTGSTDPDYYIYISDATVNNFGSVDLCRFDSAAIKSVYWNRNVGLGRNINMSATYNRTLGSTNIEDVVNLLDWTPTLEIGGASTGITYSNQIGKYTVVGRTVNFECYISLTNKGSLTGNVAVAGLPITSSDITNLKASVSVGPDGILPGSYSDISGVVLTNSTKIEIVGLVSGNRTPLTNAQLGNFSNFLITGSYVF